MNIDKELFIFGEPIETEVGLIRFLTYKEYLMNMGYLNLISMNVLHFYHQFRKMVDQKDTEALNELEDLKDTKLLSLVLSIREVTEAYMKVLRLVLDMNDPEVVEDSLEKIFDDEDLFMRIRKLVLTTNMLSEDEVSPNPEIQRGIDMSRKLKSESGDRQTSTDIISSVVAGTSTTFEEVCKMTVLQLYSIYYRIGAMKNYDTSTLFATVSSDVKIESWSKSIDLFKTETSTINKKEFDKKYGDLLR